jgi:two-component system sensor histidine kinase TctE
LLVWLLIPLGLLMVVGAFLAHLTIQKGVDSAYDKSLHAAALAISEHLRMSGSHPVVDLPPVALEMLDTQDQDRAFYSVTYRGPGQGDVFMTGYDDLPRPSDAAAANTVFYDASYRGEAIRVVALYTAMPAYPPVVVVTQVAQTTGGRRGLVRSILGQAMAQQFILLLLGAAIVWLGVTRGLAPLRELSSEVARRTATDLSPVRHSGPEEVSPLISAMDQLMARVREAIAVQRRFVADASHQLRTPLAVLRAEAESALLEEEPAALRRALSRLRDHSQATSHLASQLLSLARAEPAGEGATSLEATDLARVARETCAALVPEAVRRGADLGFECEGAAPIDADPMLIHELVANLVDNATRYAPNGTITVRVSPPSTLVVEDDGPGIPRGERDKVFERFYRMRGTPGDGAGLGLAIVREIAGAHRGTVELDEGPGGKGLRVVVRFPKGA